MHVILLSVLLPDGMDGRFAVSRRPMSEFEMSLA
jgi:hypothetical protein